MNNIFNLFVAVFSLKIAYEYLSIFFEYKKGIASYLTWGLYYIWQGVLVFLAHLSWEVNLLFTIFLVFLVALFSYYGRIVSKIIFVLMYNVLWMLSELLIGYIYMVLDISIYEEVEVGSLISKLFLWGIVCSIKYFLPHSSLVNMKKYDIVLIIIPIGSIIILNNIFSVSKWINSDTWIINSLISTGILLIINVVAFERCKKSFEEWELKQKNIFYKNQLDLFNNSIQDKQKMFLEMRRVRHDLKHHLIYLIQLIEHGETNKALDYMETLVDETITKEICNTENIVIDSLINSKNTLAEKNQIDFKFDIKVPINMPFDMADISVLLGNILDNAIESCLNCKISKRRIELSIRFEGANLLIKMENTLDKDKIRRVKGKFISTKTNAENHGLGLYSVERIVEKYHGYLECNNNDEIFLQKIILFG